MINLEMVYVTQHLQFWEKTGFRILRHSNVFERFSGNIKEYNPRIRDANSFVGLVPGRSHMIS